MKIGIDIDGVIFDAERALRFYADFWSYFTLGKDRIKNDDFTQEHCFDWTEEEKHDFYTNSLIRLPKMPTLCPVQKKF